MRRAPLRWMILLALAVMFGGHVSELFDTWDHTAQTGQDVDYSAVIVAGCAGLAFAVAATAVCALRRPRRTFHARLRESFRPLRTIAAEPPAANPSPPPLLPLRI